MANGSERVFRRQQRIAAAVYAVTRPFAFIGRRISWVVGVEEVASMTTRIAAAIDGSFSVVHTPHRFYDADYDAIIQDPSSRLAKYRRLYGGAVLLGWLAGRAHGFVYVARAGFLQSEFDERRYEFDFLRSRGRRIVCVFTGNDIRSPRLMRELEQTMGRPNIATHLFAADPVFATEEYEQRKRAIAAVADDFADAIITARVDQLSYLRSPTRPFLYFYPDEAFDRDLDKFADVDRPVILHAPSNPTLKGTPLVHDAIERLEAEGYDFEYIEVTNASNDEVLRALSRAHIVLNQFYAFVPGVFGIEALSRSCVVLMSADGGIETDLPYGANAAWVVTAPDAVYESLRAVLDEPHGWRDQARRGHDWALANASASASGTQLRALLASL